MKSTVPPLVCVFAHPDDESFGPGGSIAKFASERDVYILCVTDGNSDVKFSSQAGKNLADIRNAELLAAATVLGVKHVDFLGFPDGSLNNNNYHEMASQITEKLKKYQPDTVMTFEMRGVSGHIDHAAVSLATSFAVRSLDFVKAVLYFCEHKEVIAQIKDYFIFMPPGFGRSEVDMVVDTSQFWKQKVEAMYKHVSQKHDADMILGILSQFPKEEYFLKWEK